MTVESNEAQDITVRHGSKGDVLLFWGGPFSQWFPEYNEKWIVPADFTIAGVTYTHAEQYMMAEKARLFGDDRALRKILASASPPDMKALGRGVRGFDAKKWDPVSRDAVSRGNVAKFGQNADLRALILKTGDLIIAEASSEDTLWGIGLAAADPRATDPAKWPGQNWLGECLMVARDRVRAGEDGRT